MTALLAVIARVAVLIDDLIVCGHTMHEMQQRLKKVSERIAQTGLRLNKNRPKFAKERVEFLNFVIDSEHRAKWKLSQIHLRPITNENYKHFLDCILFMIGHTSQSNNVRATTQVLRQRATMEMNGTGTKTKHLTRRNAC